MRNAAIRDEFARLAAMAPQVSVKVTSNLRVVAHGLERRLAEGPCEVRAALLRVSAEAADGAGWGDPWDHSAV